MEQFETIGSVYQRGTNPWENQKLGNKIVFKSLLEEMVALLSPPFCGLLYVFVAYLLDKGTSGRAEPAGSAPGALFPDSCY